MIPVPFPDDLIISQILSNSFEDLNPLSMVVVDVSFMSVYSQ